MNPEVEVLVQRLPHAADLPLPSYASEGAAGMDLRAAVSGNLVLSPGERAMIPTGLRMSIPRGYEGQVRARSGLALRQGFGIVNAPGTIDSDFRGEIGVILINWGSDPQTIRRGDRIAQLVIAPVARAALREGLVESDTDRGEGGFGHTGVRD